MIVVGAGPAGAVAALRLARAGLDVLLLDRAGFPRDKACGDCLSVAATGLLAELGLLDAVRAAGAIEIRGWDIVAPAGHTARGRHAVTPALALERSRLDAVLLEHARAAGARLENARVAALLRDPAGGRVIGVRARAAGERPLTLRAPLVVGADGLRSVVARRLGVVRRPPRLRKVSLTARLAAQPGRPGFGAMHVLDGACFGVAPVAPGRLNLTLVVNGRHAAELRREGPAALVRRRAGAAPGLRASVPDLDRLLRELRDADLMASGPFDVPVATPVADGAALVGDAAGYYDPFTGQGIYQGMASAVALAAEVAPALGQGLAELDAALGRYARAQRRITRPARRVQRAIEAVLARPVLADAALGRLARTPELMDRLVAVTGDVRSARSLLSPVLLSTFLFPSTRRSA